MTTKTVHSRFIHKVGEKVEGFTIVEKRIVAPPNPVEGRRGIYDYLVEVRSRQPCPDLGFGRCLPCMLRMHKMGIWVSYLDLFSASPSS